ncbi:MAG: hypothetical protein WC061_10865 [Melioribacteraceae bacterium]
MSKNIEIRLVLIILLLPMIQFAQNKEISLQVFGGSAFPLGDFGNKISYPTEITRRSGFDFGSSTGLATTGYAAGIELTLPVLTDGLGWQTSAKFILSPTDKNTIEEEFSRDPKVNGTLTFETGNWINIPLFTGFSYGIKLSDQFNLFCHIQAGINITKQAYRKAVYTGTVVENTEYNSMTDFGLETGLSIEFNDHYVISVRYLDLGRPRYEGQRYLNEKLFTEIPLRNFTIEAEEKPVTILLLTLGFKL